MYLLDIPITTDEWSTHYFPTWDTFQQSNRYIRLKTHIKTKRNGK